MSNNTQTVPVTLQGGQMLYCMHPSDPIKGLRARSDFISKKSRKSIDASVRAARPLPFMPTDVQTTHENGMYCIQLFGAMLNGEKACAILENIPVYFDVWAPPEYYATSADQPPDSPNNGVDYVVPAPAATVARAHERLEQQISKLLAGVNLVPIKYERGQAFKPNGIQLAQSPYVRVHFTSTYDRDRAIKEVGTEFATASDDPARRYHWLVARHYNINFTQWALLSKYRGGEKAVGASAGERPPATPNAVHSSNIVSARATRMKCRTFRLNIADYSMYAGNVLQTPLLAKDRTLVMTWDIETINTGTIDPRNADDDIFMIAATFHWKDTAEPLHSVVLTTLDVPPDPRWDVIHCRDEKSLIVAFGRVFGAFAPEYWTDFNGGHFDQPYLLMRAQHHRVLGLFESFATILDRKPRTDYEVATRGVCGNLKECLRANAAFNSETTGRMIKVPENTARVVYLKLAGCVWYDTKIEMWRRHGNKTVDKKLNTYLKANKLPSKTGLSIAEMFRRVREYREARDALAALDQAQPPATYENARAPLDVAAHTAARARLDAAVAANHAIAKYCWWDAAALQALQVKRTFIADARELSAKAHVSAEDYFFLANGAKVRNMTFAKAEQQRATLYSTRVSVPARAGKFPGAHVFYPQKRIHRDRPITGLDFSSLYPSIMRAYNLSLEKITRDPRIAEWFRARGYAVYPIQFDFLGETHRAWCLRDSDEAAQAGLQRGLFPMVMDELFAERSALKKTSLFPLEAEIEATSSMLARAEKVKEGASSVFTAAELRQAAGDDAEALRVVAAAEARADTPDAGAVTAALRARLADAKFEFAAVDSKQKALKVYMNTFYGCTGNKGDLDERGKRLPDGTPIECTNPLFMLEFAAAVTSGGQYNIKYVASLVEAEGWVVTYGDTDSVYVKGPDAIYAAADARYAAACAAIPADAAAARLAAKEDYWTEMVEITMREVAALRDRVNAALRADNGTNKLSVAYEEVLFPTILCGKKKYAGIAHIERINFRPEKYFVRGIDAVVKIGQAPLVRDISDAIIWRALALDETREAREIAEDEFKRACAREWPVEYFIRTATYKPEKRNVPVLRFVERMHARVAAERDAIDAERRQYAATHGVPYDETPKRAPLYRVPEPGERFEFIICEDETMFDLRGLKLDIKNGDRMEFPDVAAALGKKPNLVHYLSQYVAGQCARFINYAFAPDDYGDEKKQDEEAQKRAKTYLIKRLKEHLGLGDAARTIGTAYRRVFRRVSADLWSTAERPLWVETPASLAASADKSSAAAPTAADLPSALVARIEQMALATANATPYIESATARVRGMDAAAFAAVRKFFCGGRTPRQAPAAAVYYAWQKRILAARQGLIEAAPHFQAVQGAHIQRLAEAVLAARAAAHAEDPNLGGIVEAPPSLPGMAAAAPASSEDSVELAQRAADAAFARYIACLEILRALHATENAVRARAEREAGGRLPHKPPPGVSVDGRHDPISDLGAAAFPLMA